MPEISVIVPVYNHERFVKKRMDSIYAQTFKDFEVIVLDDNSTDGSKKIIEHYKNRENTTIIYNTVNSGSPFAQWQKGIELSRGKMIWIAESDDYAHPALLQTLHEVMAKHKNVGLAYCHSTLVNMDGKEEQTKRDYTIGPDADRWNTSFINKGIEEIDNFLLRENTIPNASSVLLRKSAVDQAGSPDLDFRLCGDWMYWIKILAVSDIAFVAEPLNYWRQRSSNARMDCPGILEWIEGEQVLNHGLDVIGADDARRYKTLLEYLHRCWEWQHAYINELSEIKQSKVWRLFSRLRSIANKAAIYKKHKESTI